MYTYDNRLLKKRFNQSRMTYRAFADSTGISCTTLFKCMAKDHVPKVDHLVSMCNALGISPKSLFSSIGDE